MSTTVRVSTENWEKLDLIKKELEEKARAAVGEGVSVTVSFDEVINFLLNKRSEQSSEKAPSAP